MDQLPKPADQYTNAEALEEMRRRGIKCSRDQLYRASLAIADGIAYESGRYFLTNEHLDLIENVLLVQIVAPMRYEQIAVLIQCAKHHGVDPAGFLRSFAVQANGTPAAGRRHRYPGTAFPLPGVTNTEQTESPVKASA